MPWRSGRRHAIVAVQPASEAPADEVGPHDNLLRRNLQGLGEDWQDEALRLIARVDLEHPVLLEGEGVDGLELEVEHAGGRVGRLHPGRGLGIGRLDVSAAVSRVAPADLSAISVRAWSRRS